MKELIITQNCYKKRKKNETMFLTKVKIAKTGVKVLKEELVKKKKWSAE